jgi:hypothetical protein
VIKEGKEEIIFSFMGHILFVIMYGARLLNVQEGIGKCGGNVDIAICCEVHKVSASICFVSENKSLPP